MNIALNAKEAARRSFLLEASPVKVLVSVAIPLVLYNSISQIFNFFDTLIAANISAQVISTVSFVAQIQHMLAAIGYGLSIGGGILIARNYGAGNMKDVNRLISTLVFLAIGIGLLLLLVMLPFPAFWLRVFGMPQDMFVTGIPYFMIELLAVTAIFINTIYFAIEKARGNTKAILYSNLLMLSVKLVLTVFFVFVLKGGILMLSLASLLAHCSLTVVAFLRLTHRDNAFRLSLKHADFRPGTVLPMLKLSLPVFLERFSFNFGKVIVNGMSASYGSMVVGALGVSNRLGGMSTTPPAGFQEAEASLVSQSIGNNNIKRALALFKRTFIINMGIGIFFFILMSVFRDQFVGLFAKGDGLFALEIGKIYDYERYATVLLAASSSVMGLLYGFGYTRVSMILNMIRLFVYRIPPLWILMKFTSIGSEAVGIAMLVSNGLIGITATIVAFFVVRRIKRGQLGAGLTEDMSSTEDCPACSVPAKNPLGR